MRKLGMLLICAVAMLWVFAFTPNPYVLATIPGFLGMMAAFEFARSKKQILGICVLFGGLAIGYGYHWLAGTVQDFGGIDVVSSWAMTALFGVIGTVHVLIFALFYRGMVRSGRRPHPLLVVSLWAACEALPIRLFPWMLGHGAVNCPPLLQQAEWGGVTGVTVVMLLLLVPVHEWIRWAFRLDGENNRPGAAVLTFAVGLACFGWGHWRYLDVLAQDKTATEHIKVAIVQPDIGAGDKRNAENKRRADEQRLLQRMKSLSEKAAKTGAELIVWPETAIAQAVPLLLPKFDAAVTSNFLGRVGFGFLNELGKDRAFLVGAYERIPPEGPRRPGSKGADFRHNVAALRYPGGREAKWAVYRKEFLIPFGETTPYGLFDDRLPQRFKMLPGVGPQEPFTFQGKHLVPFLCYEGILPDHVRVIAGDKRPDMLVSLTNDSWFGDTWEPHQHLNFTRFRAVEHRAPLVRATNTGISAFVNSAGDVVRRLELYKHDILVEDVPIVARGRTIYSRFGYHLKWVLAGLALLGLLGAAMRRE